MKPYTPETLPLKNLNYELLFPYLGEASSELARYDGFLQGIPNPTILLSPLTTKEAVFYLPKSKAHRLQLMRFLNKLQ